MFHIGIGRDDGVDLFLVGLHARKRHVLAGLGRAHEHARVLLREQALGYHDVKQNGKGEGCDGEHERRELVAQDPVEAAGVDRLHGSEPALGHAGEAARLFMRRSAQQARGHGRRERQRNHGRDHDGDAEGDREFAKKAPDDAAHE